TVLTVGAGPCKEIEDAVKRGQMAPGVEFTAIDIDQRAIEFAKSRVAKLASVRFERVNAMRFRSEGTFSLVYSLGLFDYLSDRAFVALARRLGNHLRPGGRLVIGNFGEFNPTRGYMEFGGWGLEHRSAARLKRLAAESGLDGAHVTSDSTGVNLFLHFSAA
ncbi:MAG: class I SAM-dependent methyltransferase, partial [Planctomycetota bacterium]